MLKTARLICREGHEWLSFLYDSDKAPDAWAEYNLGMLAASFEPDPPFIQGCPVCGATDLCGEILDYRPNS